MKEINIKTKNGERYIKINRCNDCCFYIVASNITGMYHHCVLEKENIKEVNYIDKKIKIPLWCPLPEVKKKMQK